MFSPISLWELRGDRDCISVHEPVSVNSFPAPLLGWLYLGLYPSIACQRIRSGLHTRAHMCMYDTARVVTQAGLREPGSLQTAIPTTR